MIQRKIMALLSYKRKMSCISEGSFPMLNIHYISSLKPINLKKM